MSSNKGPWANYVHVQPKSVKRRENLDEKTIVGLARQSRMIEENNVILDFKAKPNVYFSGQLKMKSGFLTLS